MATLFPGVDLDDGGVDVRGAARYDELTKSGCGAIHGQDETGVPVIAGGR